MSRNNALEKEGGRKSENEMEQRHAEVMAAIRDNNWQPSKRNDIAEFSSQLDSNADRDLEIRFYKIILSRLHFRDMPNRAEAISKSHQNTFKWILHGKPQESQLPSWDSLTDWLCQENSSIYWIAGKPGSGKSTLMRFLSEHDRIFELVHQWVGQERLLKASFYFWNSGTAMQMSRLGLLQTLLYSCLSQDKALITSIFTTRWEQYQAFGGGREPFDWPELQRAFNTMLSNATAKFFFLIDGLDEFDGEPKEIIDMVINASRPHVKLCVASRPWTPFENAFGKRPNLLLEQLTYRDISLYVTTHFEDNEFVTDLRIGIQ